MTRFCRTRPYLLFVGHLNTFSGVATGGSGGSMIRGPRAPGAPKPGHQKIKQEKIGILMKNYAGVQKRIIDHSPNAVYVHCICHRLNLMLRDAAECCPEMQ